MSIIRKTALALAVSAVSAGAQAELKALDDNTMGEMTGQAGLTIDLETKYTIGEFMYKDAGSVFLNGISFGSNENVESGGFFDNVRVKLDIAGSGTLDVKNAVGDGTTPELGTNPDNLLETGFSGVRKVASIQGAASSGAGNVAEASKFYDLYDGELSVADAQSAGQLRPTVFLLLVL